MSDINNIRFPGGSGLSSLQKKACFEKPCQKETKETVNHFSPDNSDRTTITGQIPAKSKEIFTIKDSPAKEIAAPQETRPDKSRIKPPSHVTAQGELFPHSSSKGNLESLAVLETPPILTLSDNPPSPKKISGISPMVKTGAGPKADPVNFAHLESLEFKYKGADGKEYTSWAIYAEPDDPNNLNGPYHQVEAPGEGYGCIDDVARVGLVYMDNYKRTGNGKSLEKSKEAMEFILSLTDGKGDYYNFVDKNGKINHGGITSKPDLDWWTARAFYALGKGISAIGDNDPALTSRMKGAYLKTLDKLMERRENPKIHQDVLPIYEKTGIEPGTLINDSGSITSIFVLGLVEGYNNVKDPRMEGLIRDYCSSLVKLEEKSTEKYPLGGFHYNSLWDTDLVHLYGNRQPQALAEAGSLLGEKRWIDSAEGEVNKAYPQLLSSWGMPFALSPDPEVYPQIPYSAESVISNTMAVHRATGKTRYAAIAGLAGAWFFGDNPGGKPVYNPATGRAFDGIDRNGMNRNSGAESNIEALLALETMQETPASQYLDMKPLKDGQRKPLLISGESLKPSGPTEKFKRVFNGGATGEVVKMLTSSSLEGKIPANHGEPGRIYLNYRLTSDGPGKLEVKTESGRKTIPLIPSDADYHYRSVFIGKTGDNPGGTNVTISNNMEGQDVNASSIVIQPDLQWKTWTKGGETLTMVVNASPEEKELPSHLQQGQEILYSGSQIRQKTLKQGGWVLLKSAR